MKNKNGSRYFEYYAKITLVDYYIFDNDSLIVSDKPDLQSERLDCGIEVTQAISRAEALRNEQEDEGMTSSRLNLIRERITDKSDKLNRNYKLFKTNGLYVFAKTAKLNAHDLDIVKTFIQAAQEDHAITFDLYFLNCIDKLCIYDPHKDRFDTVGIPTSELTHLKRKAKLAAQSG